jgi:ribonucleoside-triphosphate reductase (formate)
MVKTKCEVYSRVVGYIRPVSNWNDSKQQEFHDRKMFDGGIKDGKQKQNAVKQ